MAVLAGFAAGTIATVAQMTLWWLTSVPVLETLLRDARLTAAIVLGRRALPQTSTWQWDILLVATLIHFALSIAYAVIPALCASRLRTRSALVAGAVYGLAIYGINLYGFTVLFPWFAVARGGVAALTHVVFGVSLAGACQLLISVSPVGTGESSSD
ncbi:MAG: hypothetical protein HYZ18_01410 [Pseudogulbenkiania sp.]|nr:hypothetical protein [Pseudogulbenkiania sp.]